MSFLVFLVTLLTTSTQAQAPPVFGCPAAEHRQFDFWVGEWEVVTPAGQVAGTNSITRELGGCLIQERWRGIRGLQGSSFNMYNAATRSWQQTWVDNTGMVLTLTGQFRDNAMQMTGASEGPKGRSLNRLTWTPLPQQQVRQLWEVSADGGSTWTTVFDGTYRKKP